jgi:hypothetical protein
MYAAFGHALTKTAPRREIAGPGARRACERAKQASLPASVLFGAMGGPRWTPFSVLPPHSPVVTSPITPLNTGFEDNLYTLDGIEGEQRQVVETQFMAPGVDSPAAVVLEKMLAGGLRGLTGDERTEFTRFVLSLEYRGPQSLKEMAALAGNVVRQNLDVADDEEYRALRKLGDPETLHEWALDNVPEMLTNAHKRWLPGIIDNPDVGQHVINMPWAVINVSGSKHTLLTADRPLYRELGLDDPKAIWALPLSPTHLFAGANTEETLHSLSAAKPDRVVQTMNNALVRYAVRAAYGDSPRHLAFVERRLRRNDDPVTPGIAGRILAGEQIEIA